MSLVGDPEKAHGPCIQWFPGGTPGVPFKMSWGLACPGPKQSSRLDFDHHQGRTWGDGVTPFFPCCVERTHSQPAPAPPLQPAPGTQVLTEEGSSCILPHPRAQDPVQRLMAQRETRALPLLLPAVLGGPGLPQQLRVPPLRQPGQQQGALPTARPRAHPLRQPPQPGPRPPAQPQALHLLPACADPGY